MIAKIKEGGLYLQDLETKIKAIKLNWINKLYDTNHQAPWKTYILQIFKADIYIIVRSNISQKNPTKWKTYAGNGCVTIP